jgi:rare lipoprotein A
MLKRQLCLSILLSLVTLAAQAKLPETGYASFYGRGFLGRHTASGERYNKDSFTAAHKSLPFGTRVRVVNLDNDKSVVVRINDRGPLKHGRVIDLSIAAAKAIGILSKGLAHVRLEAVDSDPVKDEGALVSPDGSVNPTDNTAVVTKKNSVQAGYVLQTGAFRQYANAENSKKQLLKKGYKTVNIVEEKKDSETVYRVEVGPYATLPETLRVKSALKKAQIDSLVLRK